MGQLVASDLNNPDYVGAVNPDSRLAVRFYKKAVLQPFLSEKEGRPIYQDMDFIKIMVPGDSTFDWEGVVRDDHKERFPLHWARYQNATSGDQKEIGTPLAEWSRLQPSQVEELRALKFYTVESIATASDGQLQRIGMIAGVSPHAFREHAQRFLKIAQRDAEALKAEEQMKAMQAQVDAIREEAAKQVAEMRAAFDAQLAELAEKKKPGRKAKAAE